MKRLLPRLFAIALGAVGLVAAQSATAWAQNSKEPVTLRFPSWQWGQPGYDEFYTAAIKEFERTHPNVKFEKIPIASASYADDLVKMFAADDPPEIVQYLSQFYFKAAAAGWLEQLDERLAKTDIPASWAPYLEKAGTQDGKTYGIWVSGYSDALMYNKKMLAEAGVKVPTTPTELLDAAKKLTKRDADGTISQYGFSLTTKMDNNAYIYGFAALLVGSGGGWGESADKLDVMNPANKKAIELERDLIKAKVVPLDADRIRARATFYQGKAAMIIEGPWVMVSAQKENPEVFSDLAVAPIPFPQQVAGPSNGFAIATKQKHKDLAWEFITMITSKPWMEKYGEMTGVVPARQGALTDKALASYPWLSVFSQNEKTGKSYLIPGLEDVDSEIDKMVIDHAYGVFFKDKSADDALLEIKAGLTDLVKNH